MKESLSKRVAATMVPHYCNTTTVLPQRINIRFRAVSTQTYAVLHFFGRYYLKFQQDTMSFAAHEIRYILPASLSRYSTGPCNAPAIGIKSSGKEPRCVTTCKVFVILITLSPSLN